MYIYIYYFFRFVGPCIHLFSVCNEWLRSHLKMRLNINLTVDSFFFFFNIPFNIVLNIIDLKLFQINANRNLLKIKNCDAQIN